MRNPELVFSILGGSLIIGVGLFLGLRARPGNPTDPKPAPLTVTAAPLSSVPVAHALPGAAAGVPLSILPGTPAPAKDEVTEQVSKAITAMRPTLKKKCWDDSAAKNPTPKSVKLTWNGTIGPSGNATAFGISEHPEAFRVGVSGCVTTALVNLAIAPPSQPVEVTVDFEVP